ncbi:MAG: hypothetical protein ACLFOY_09735 [Desulfatibacillaceae bacterium]
MDSKELCSKIEQVYPEIGECGIDVQVEWSDEKNCWIVDLKRGDEHLQHHLEPQDADLCMDGKQCVSLGLEIAQLRQTLERKENAPQG